jgi:hypothetical protein
MRAPNSAYITNEIWSERSRDDPYGLTTDEAGALALYTMDGEPNDESIDA